MCLRLSARSWPGLFLRRVAVRAVRTALRSPGTGRRVGKSEEIVSWAYARVIARHEAAGTEVPFGQLVIEVRAEAAAELHRRIAKNLRRIASAVARIRADSEVLAGMQQAAARIRANDLQPSADAEHEFADLDPGKFALVLAGRRPPARVNGHGRGVPAGAAWPPGRHPELDPDPENDDF